MSINIRIVQKWKPYSKIKRGGNCFKKSKLVSRVLFPDSRGEYGLLSFIWDWCHHQPQTTYPSRDSAEALNERATLTGIYLVFQLLGFTAIPITRKSRELLPRVFTLTLFRRFIFCGTFRPWLPRSFPLGSRMLCVARTFLSPRRNSDRTACKYKDSYLAGDMRKLILVHESYF